MFILKQGIDYIWEELKSAFDDNNVWKNGNTAEIYAFRILAYQPQPQFNPPPRLPPEQLAEADRLLHETIERFKREYPSKVMILQDAGAGSYLNWQRLHIQVTPSDPAIVLAHKRKRALAKLDDEDKAALGLTSSTTGDNRPPVSRP